MNSFTRTAEHKTVPKTDEFDPASGTLVERLLFNHRRIILGVCILLSLVLGAFVLGGSPEFTIQTSPAPGSVWL